MSNKNIGFLQIIQLSADSYIGAILVTDVTSVPVEFRVTLPVKPTPIQKSLYGEAMIPYIGTELCGLQLLQNITHQLDLIFVSPEYMLEIRPKSDTPVLYIQPISTSKTPIKDNDNELQWQWEFSAKDFQPVSLTTAINFVDDYDVIQPLFNEIATRFDLLEPFTRINRAIEVLAQQDKRFTGN